jgi:hypothetical protein
MPPLDNDDPTAFTGEIAVAILRADSEAEAGQVARRLLGHRDAKAVIDLLARNADPVVRAWAADRSVELPAVADAQRTLRMLAHDRDSDVRDVAIGHLMKVGNEHDQQLVLRSLVSDLSASDFGSNRFGLWRLARVRATAALPAIAAFRADRRNPWKDLAGGVAVAIIEGRDREVVDALAAHDHDRTQFLAIGAAVIGSTEAVAALRLCSVEAPDERCRHDCAVALGLVEGRDATV